MTRFIFESDIPSWNAHDVLKARLDQWVLSGMDTVILQVDDGHGATWDTPAWGSDQRVSKGALTRAVDAIHDRGMSVVACVSLAAFNSEFSHFPELKLGNFQFPFYNFWSDDFRARRLQMLQDLVAACDIDGLALDYLRTGREAINGEIPAASVLSAWIAQVRAAVSAGVPILGVHHSSYATSVKEGVDISRWTRDGHLDGSVLFNYESVFPFSHAEAALAGTGGPVWVLIGNYDWTNNAAEVRSGHHVARIWRRAAREIRPDGIGVYLANLFTWEQAKAIHNTQRMLPGL